MANLALVFDLMAKDNASGAFDKVGNAAQRAGDKGSGFGSAIGKAMGIAAGAVAAVGIGAFFVDSVKGASDLNETLSKSNNIFGENAAEVEKWANGAAKSFGLSKSAALEAASGFGNMLQQLGFSGDAAVQASEGTVKLAADLGSFNNLETGDVLDRIGAAMRGEYDSLQTLIPNINAARVEQEAMAETGKTSAKALTAQEKATATLAIIQRDGAAAADDFAETSGGLANQTKIAAAQFDDMKAKLGSALLPTITGVMGFISNTALPVLSNLGGAAGQVFGVLFRGDFTGGPFAEDSPFIDKVFKVRDALVIVGGIAKQTFDILFRGDFTGGPLAEDSGTVDVLFRLRDAFIGLAGFLTGTVIPAFAAVGAAVLSTAAFFAQHQAAATALGVVVGGILAVMVAAWLAQAAVAISSAASSVIAWFTLATASTTSATIQSRSTAQIVVGWIAAAASSIASAATVVAGWVLMGAQSLVQAARMAAAWFIALGPIGWVTAAIIGIAALIIANWDKVVGWTKAAWSAVSGAVSAAWSAVKSAVSAGISAVVGFMRGLPGQILGAIGNLGSLLVGAGGDLLRGLVNGIKGAIGSVVSAAKNAAKAAVDGVKSFLGIHSPSKVFTELGGYVGQGFVNGIDSMQPAVAASMQRMADTSALDSLIGGRSMIRLADVSWDDRNKLMAAGWKGRAGDKVEALYRPSSATAPSAPGGPMEITGTLMIGGDGLARIVDGRLVTVLNAVENRQRY